MKKSDELIFRKDMVITLIRDYHHLFSNKPILELSGTSDVLPRFKGITRHITCVFEQSGTISVCAYYRNTCHDIVEEFALSAERTLMGHFRCGLCRTNPGDAVSDPLPEYESIEQLWIEHCLKPLAEWTLENFTNDALLCLCRSRGCTAAFVCNSESKKERIVGRKDFFKAVPVRLKPSR
jgi:hypothetical protein